MTNPIHGALIVDQEPCVKVGQVELCPVPGNYIVGKLERVPNPNNAGALLLFPVCHEGLRRAAALTHAADHDHAKLRR